MGTVLVVDDDADLRRMIGRLLQHHGYEVRLAADGAEALAACEETLPDAIIADLMMPNLDGEAFLVQLRERHPSHQAAIVLLTASALRSEVADRIQVSAALAKPFDTRELQELVRELIGDP